MVKFREQKGKSFCMINISTLYSVIEVCKLVERIYENLLVMFWRPDCVRTTVRTTHNFLRISKLTVLQSFFIVDCRRRVVCQCAVKLQPPQGFFCTQLTMMTPKMRVKNVFSVAVTVAMIYSGIWPIIYLAYNWEFILIE